MPCCNTAARRCRRGSQTPIGFITATVPSGTTANPTPYKAKDLLHLSGVSLNGGAIPVATSDALHLVAYVGDADGNGSYSSNDAVLITRVTLQTDSGFTAYPLVDPVIVADTDGAGFIPADAALQANEAGVGFPTTNLTIPPIPSGVVFQPIANNVDPSVSIPATLHVGADGTVTVPVNIDDAAPGGQHGPDRGPPGPDLRSQRLHRVGGGRPPGLGAGGGQRLDRDPDHQPGHGTDRHRAVEHHADQQHGRRQPGDDRLPPSRRGQGSGVRGQRSTGRH